MKNSNMLHINAVLFACNNLEFYIYPHLSNEEIEAPQGSDLLKVILLIRGGTRTQLLVY